MFFFSFGVFAPYGGGAFIATFLKPSPFGTELPSSWKISERAQITQLSRVTEYIVLDWALQEMSSDELPALAFRREPRFSCDFHLVLRSARGRGEVGGSSEARR